MLPPKPKNPSAGSAEPSWFEWQTGLLSLVEMLDEDSPIIAVAFQLCGIKGWDDVGVRFCDGRTRLMQMKHSRSGDTLTFGDLIEAGESDSPSLLRGLANAWQQEYALRGTVACVLVTNRHAGPNWYKGRPPLADFFTKIKGRVSEATAIGDISWDGEDTRYPIAWALFLAELSDLEPAEQIGFLQSLELQTSAPDLPALEMQLHERLSVLTGLPPSSVQTLFNAMHAHLSKWTCHSRRETEWIDREALRAYLAGDDAAMPWSGHCEVETPEPFFPSRVPVLERLGVSLLNQSAHKVDFLSAEPGAGKTSCISKLARSGARLWQEQCVSIRFYAYRPLRPGQPDVGGDADGVRPEALWLGLLWQIRDNLRKTQMLAHLRVPVWLVGMPWRVAREHVLRLADSLGQRWGRPFVICIDGIDHAARAHRKHLPQFLGTLPSPEAIPAHVRVLLAGQPAESCPEYPFFLRHPHTSVHIHSLSELSDEDLRLLWRAARPRITAQAENAVLRLLAERTRRRTLPTVYAVEDIRESTSLEAAAAILDARPLADSLHHYYDAIWSAAKVTAGENYRLAAAFALLRERPTGELMVSAFSNIVKSATEWKDILRSLRPLVRETEQGFELVHNDLRVHLEARLAGDPTVRCDAASTLADYYRKPMSNRLAAHWSLLDLLVTAGREVDFANDFTVDWIVEAGSLSVADETIPRECNVAFRAAVARRDWLLLHQVGCAALTFHRLHECVHEWSGGDSPPATDQIPPFLPVEGEPLPLELWTASSFSELVAACKYLADRGVPQRAALVLKQWIGGVQLETLVQKASIVSERERLQGNSADAMRRTFEQFGRLCAITGVSIPSSEGDPEKHTGHFAAIEKGWAEGLTERTDRRVALRLWCSRPPRFLGPWIAAVKTAAARSHWGEVRALLHKLEGSVESLETHDRLLLGWYAARAKPRRPDIWSKAFGAKNYGLALGHTPLTVARTVAQWLTYSNPLREPAQIADELFPLLDLRESDSKNPAPVRQLLRGSAILGRILRYRDRSDLAGVGIVVPPSALLPYLDALWCRKPDWRNLPHQEVQTPGEVGRTLAEAVWECGLPYRKLLHDLAMARFADVMLERDGCRVFDMLWELGERAMLREAVSAKAQEILAHLHEQEISSRTEAVTNLVHFARRLELSDLETQLLARLGGTRTGYGCHKEWVFQPLVRWFEVLRRQEPSLWKSEGMQLLALDRISEQQGADNRSGDELTAEVAAAAMTCGANDFEALIGFFVDRDARYPLWDLAKAAQDGFKICLSEGRTMTEESVLARTALSIAVGRWPRESPLCTISALLTAHGVPTELAQHPTWRRAVCVAAEMQGVPAVVNEHERAQVGSDGPAETRNAEAILAEILDPTNSPWARLRNIAALAQQVKTEGLPNCHSLIATALESLESSEAFGRCLEFHDIRLMSRLYAHLTESEFWRVLGAITAVTGDMRVELTDANWAFMVAFSAADLACRARAPEAGRNFALTIFRQLLSMHWKWHGTAPPQARLDFCDASESWPDATRRMLLSLTRTDGCEPLYMVMCGLRFFADVFPEQISALCREGLADERAADALLPLAQLWATRHPQAVAGTLDDFRTRESVGTLDDRLDAWAVNALFRLVTGHRPQRFPIPSKESIPEIAFPGDAQLFEPDVDVNGLIQHNSFAQMANKRLRRGGLILGSMDKAFRYLVRTIRESNESMPSLYLGPAKRLAFDENFPRPSKRMENLVGDAILHQCAGENWTAGRAAAVRLAIGYGIDPWIASATPNLWPDDKTWPSDSEIERWMEEGASPGTDVARKIHSLLTGGDLDQDTLLLGAVLRIPTYRRDLEFRCWLTKPRTAESSVERAVSFTPAGRTLASWLAGWSFTSRSTELVSVQFVGGLVNYPNGELELTPTNCWIDEWGWRADPENALRFRTANGTVAAWYDRSVGPDTHSRQTCRQPLLSRWIAKRGCIPPEFDRLKGWTQNTETLTGMLSRPE